MAAQLQQAQLKRLCSTPEVYEKAQSILRLATARTGPGSGFIVKPAFLPAVCAYLASEGLNTTEVTLKSAAGSACVSQNEFSGIINTVRTALGASGANSHSQASAITYETLVDAYHIVPRDEAVAWMQDAEDCIRSINLLRQRYGKNGVVCAVFYWVCQLMEEHAVEAKHLSQTFSGVSLTRLKTIVKTVDNHCDSVADAIKSQLPQIRKAAFASASTSTPMPTPKTKTKATGPKLGVPIVAITISPVKSAMKKKEASANANASANKMPPVASQPQQPPFMTPTKHASSSYPLRRGVAFSQESLDEDVDMDDEESSFPETPTKRRKLERSRSPSKIGRVASARTSPMKQSPTIRSGSTDVFREALTRNVGGGSSSKQSTNKHSGHANTQSLEVGTQEAGPSTPRPSRIYRPALPDVEPTSEDNDTLSNPSPALLSSRPTRTTQQRRRFRPVYIDQQQWLSRDPKVERIWRDAERHRDRMTEFYGHPFARFRDGKGLEVVGGC
ncbi:hypothetical protein F5I97DRAFT_1837509 [Phlebopus sp. FC_14]|nr:hypothetical protein F5I97DRAFT_1837509 [Phlebopus sp. FC_14]